MVNGTPVEEYFEENPRWREALAPFRIAGLDSAKFDIQAHVTGRAKRWSKRQPRALAHAIAGALTALDPPRRGRLRRAGFRFKVLTGLGWLVGQPPSAWLTPDADPDDLWAQHHALLRGPLPREWTGDPHVLTFGGRWLLDVLLMPMDDEALHRVREYLAQQGQAVSDVDILRDVFQITPRDDAFDRWRFSLSYLLHQKAKELEVEFVGLGKAWAWALKGAPIEKPGRHRRLRGTEGLPVVYVMVEEVAEDLTRDDEPLDVPEEEEPKGEWKPTRQTWEYVLTYYDWDNGILPYNRQAREMIPPPDESLQERAVLWFVAEQMDDKPFPVGLHRHDRTWWLQGRGLKELFVGCLVPGARIWVDRTEEPNLYKIRYRPTEPRKCRLLFFAEGRIRPEIREVEVACEVDETMLLAEGRYSDIEALDRLDLVDRRTAPKVLARVFELIGLKDESRGVYRARFDDLFPLLCVTKPYSKAYVRQILYDRRNYPWFYHDEERGAGWFVYDPNQIRVKGKREGQKEPKPSSPPAPRSFEGIWGEVAKLAGRELHTLHEEAPFRVEEVNEREVVLRLSTGATWKLSRKGVERAWEELVRRGELSRTWIWDEVPERGAAYIAAILAALPGVRYETEPIRLFYEPPPREAEVPDIGIRHIVHPIPFHSAPLPSEIQEALWERVGPLWRGDQATFWSPQTPEELDEYLMQAIADRSANRFVTPRPVADFMVNLAQPKPSERVADICCGTGIFLAKALRFVKEVYGEEADLELYGADIYHKAVEATHLNLQANGARDFTVVQANSLEEQEGIFAQKYDLILGNPPFGRGQVRAFLRRWAGLLAPGGRMVVNVSDSLLANSGRGYRECRQWLVEHHEVEAVASLPRPPDSTLYGTKSNLMFLRNRRAHTPHRTLLAAVGSYEELPLVLQIAGRGGNP